MCLCMCKILQDASLILRESSKGAGRLLQGRYVYLNQFDSRYVKVVHESFYVVSDFVEPVETHYQSSTMTPKPGVARDIAILVSPIS
jgi:hypothetical protein